MWIPVYVDSNSIAVFADVSLLIAVVPQTDFIYYKQNKKGQQNDAFPYYIFLSVFFPAFFFITHWISPFAIYVNLCKNRHFITVLHSLFSKAMRRQVQL